jgi:asparagine synthase (glutamine-hydrolysing)
MSGFFGIFRPQGGPVDLEAFEQMKTVMHREGFDSLETHVEDKIAMGHLMLRVSPESKYDKQPLKSSCGNYILVGHFRLDYRDELGDKLGLTHAELEMTPDSQLAMLAYQKWQKNCVKHLEGDFVFLIYNFITHDCFFVKDRTGYSSLFYFKHQGVFYFSTSADLFDSLSNIHFKLNKRQLCRMSLSGIGPEVRETLYLNVFCLISSEIILVNSLLVQNHEIYWRIDEVKQNNFRYITDYVHLFSSVFSQAVKSRVFTGGKFGVFLSGGLDSGAVAVFSSLELKYKNLFLHSFTTYPLCLSNLDKEEILKSNERPSVEYLVSKLENIIPTYLNFPEIKVSDLFNSSITKNIYYPIMSFNSYWILGTLQHAKKGNVTTMLNGQLGNFTISSSAPFLLLEFIFKFKYLRLYKELLLISKFEKKSIFQVFYDNVYLHFKIYLKSHVSYLYLFSNSYFKKNPQIYSKVYKSMKFKKSESEFLGESYPIRNSRSLRSAQLIKHIPIASNLWYKFGCEYQIENVDPTSDSRLINCTFSFPEYLYKTDGKTKFIYKEMMRNVLVEFSANRSSGFIQSYDFPIRLKNEDKIIKIFENLKLMASTDPIFNLNWIENELLEVMTSDSPQKKRGKFFEIIRVISLISFVFQKK